MVKAAYFHSIGGASGDMALAALVDAGLPLPKLEEALDARMQIGIKPGLSQLSVPELRDECMSLGIDLEGVDETKTNLMGLLKRKRREYYVRQYFVLEQGPGKALAEGRWVYHVRRG